MTSPNPAREITPTDTAAALRADPARYFILDCRLPEEFETAKLDNSLLIPLHELEDRIDDLEDELEDRGLPKDTPFAVLCHHGVRSLDATLILHHLGFAGARSIFGGIELWAIEADTSVPRYTRRGSRCTIVR